MEIVDIVDEADAILYNATKEEAHRKGLLHRTVIGEVRDDSGRILLVRQAPDRQDPGKYVSPVGGHVRSGESNDDALKRETLEEIGLSGFEFRLLGKFVYNRFVRKRQENHYFIVYELLKNGEIRLGAEAVSWKAFDEEELREELSENRDAFGAAYIAIAERFYPRLLK